MTYGSDSYGVGQSLSSAGTFTSVSVWRDYACAIRDTGQVACWALGESGRWEPVVNFVSIAGPAGTFTSLSAVNRNVYCGVRDTGTVECWGTLPLRSAIDYGQADPPAGTFTSVSAGSYATCGIRDTGEVACWGNYAYGVNLEDF